MATTGIVANPDGENGVLLIKTTTTPATPAAGNLKLFVDSADDDTKQVDSTGTVTALGGSSSPTTTRGDIIRRGASADERLALGAANAIVMSDGTDTIYRTPPRDSYTTNEGSNYTTSSTSFVDVDATNLNLSITTNGGNVLIGWAGFCEVATSGQIFFEIDVDGSPLATNDGIIRTASLGNTPQDISSFVRLITGLSAASHIFKLQWKVSAGTGTIYAGAGTANKDLHPQFWVMEI